MARDGYFELPVETLDHPVGTGMVSGALQALKPDGQPEKPEKVRFELLSLVRGNAARGAKTSNLAGEEGRGDIFRSYSIEGPCLRPLSKLIDAGEAAVIGTAREKGLMTSRWTC